MIRVNLDKARAITHNRRREKRVKDFAPHDQVISMQIPGADLAAAEAARKAIRERDARVQRDIDACTTVEQLKALIAQENL